MRNFERLAIFPNALRYYFCLGGYALTFYLCFKILVFINTTFDFKQNTRQKNVLLTQSN